MKKDEKILNVLNDVSLPTYEEIPDIGLYLDQVVKYINAFFVDFPEMNVTSSMVTNYVKQKVVQRLHKKTYVRDQIACFIMIAMAKTVLSIENIKLYLDTNEEDTFEVMYNNFREATHQAIQGLQSKAIKQTRAKDDMMYSIATAIAHKMYLERKFTSYKEKLEG